MAVQLFVGGLAFVMSLDRLSETFAAPLSRPHGSSGGGPR